MDTGAEQASLPAPDPRRRGPWRRQARERTRRAAWGAALGIGPVGTPATAPAAPADAPAKPTGHAGIRAYLHFIGTFRRQMLMVIAVFAVADAALAIVPLFVGRFVAALATTPHHGVRTYTVLLIACAVFHDLVWRTAELLFLRYLNPRGYDYQNLLFRRVIDQEYPYFTARATGKISGYCKTLGQEFRDFLDALCFNYVDQLVKLPAIVIIMFSVNLPTGLLFTFGVGLLFAVGRRTAGRSSKEERGATDITAEMDSYLIDVIANFVSVKSFRRERVEYTLAIERRHGVVKASNRSMLWAIVFWGSMSVVVRYLIWPGAILLNLYFYLHHQESIGQLSTFLAGLVIFADFIWGAIWETSQLNLKLARIEEAYGYLFGKRDILDDAAFPDPDAPGPDEIPAQPVASAPHPPTRPDGPARIPAGGLGSLELRDVTFAYPDNPEVRVLDGVTLTIAPHEKVGVVGRSGSGKTTLLKLLLGYYPLPLGAVALNGQPLPNRRLAHAISYVPQDINLFHRSIRDNIAYGAPAGLTDDDVELAARRAHAHEFIARAVQGYDTLVGERGIKLSTGQRQRIAIARAFLDQKPLLVLDEATSALDSESERLVQHALEELWQERTVIAVAHRLSTLLRMDRIIVFDAGRIVEQGSHQQLLEAQGTYHRLWQQQSGEMLALH